ncbi:MAG: hypothetical protein KAW84_00655 [Thermoplasmata archaeon]|nr:hypothetical protein [Thermoplasmata archaeon]
MLKDELTLAEIGLVVLAGEDRKPGLLLDDGKGIVVPVPGMPDCRLTMRNKRGIVKILFMRRKTEFPYHR